MGKAYDELMGTLGRYKAGPGGARDREAARKRKQEEFDKAAEQAKKDKAAQEREGGTAGRVRRGFTNRNEMHDAAAKELEAEKAQRRMRRSNGVRG